MSDTLVDISGLTEAEAITELIGNGYDDLIYDVGDWEAGYAVVDVVELDEGRWQKFMESIIQAPSGKYFSLNWERGLTECQDQKPFEYSYPEPVEVKRVEKKVTIVEWLPADA